MTFEETLEALRQLAGRPVAVDSSITRTLTNLGDMPPPRSDDAWWIHEGVLEVRELDQPTYRAVDAAAWWQQPDKVRISVYPEGGILLGKDRFKRAHWENNVLVIEAGSIESRIVPLVRPSGRYEIRRPAIKLTD